MADDSETGVAAAGEGGVKWGEEGSNANVIGNGNIIEFTSRHSRSLDVSDVDDDDNSDSRHADNNNMSNTNLTNGPTTATPAVAVEDNSSTTTPPSPSALTSNSVVSLFAPSSSPDKEKFSFARYHPRNVFKRITRPTLSSADATLSTSTSSLASSAETSSRKVKVQQWNSVVTIVLVEGRNLLAKDDNGLSDPYVKFKLGTERYKSKYKNKTLNPKWLEQFDLYMYDDQTNHLEINVFDHDSSGRDDFMGRTEINLSELALERTHNIEQKLEDGAGLLHMLITVSGTVGTKSRSELQSCSVSEKQREEIASRYSLRYSLKNVGDVGWLQVKVLRAVDLRSADIGGKSDPYCVLELVNERLQTHTEYKTLSPEWGKVFTFNVLDLHSVLEVTVYDEDADKKVEFLGKVAIPLLRVNCGKPQWYRLKDRKLLSGAQGAILLELDFIFNHFKAAIRTFNPREEKYMTPEPKFRLSTMKGNINRVQKYIEGAIEAGNFLQSCFDWESRVRSILAFIVFLVVVYNFELYMAPLTLLVIFLKNYFIMWITGTQNKDNESFDVRVEDDDDDDLDDDKKGKSQTFRERLQSIQDVLLRVQDTMEMIASLCERAKNALGWSVPWLTTLAIIVLSIASIVLYLVPLRYLILAWGINKFTKKLRAPNAINNNELLDYLSRVPSDKQLVEYRELRVDPLTTLTRKR